MRTIVTLANKAKSILWRMDFSPLGKRQKTILLEQEVTPGEG